jgi:hypothetical protein
MNSFRLKGNHHAWTVLLTVLVAVVCLFSGCSIRLNDDDTYEASGNYVFDAVNGSYYLFLEVDKSRFPDDCGLKEDLIQFSRISVGAEEMVLPESNDSDFFFDETQWERSGEGSSGDIVGKWTLTLDDDDDVTISLRFYEDHTFKMEASNLSCDDFPELDSDVDNEVGFTEVDGTWSLTFKNSADPLEEPPLDYELTTNSAQKTFTLTRSDKDLEDDWYQWEGTFSVNTYSHYKITEFERYLEEGESEPEIRPGTYTSRLTFTLTSRYEIEEGTLSETWTFTDTQLTPVTKSHTFTGTREQE